MQLRRWPMFVFPSSNKRLWNFFFVRRLLEHFKFHRARRATSACIDEEEFLEIFYPKKNMCTMASCKQKSPPKQCLLIIFLLHHLETYTISFHIWYLHWGGKSRILIFCARRHWTAFVHQTSPHVASADDWMKRKHHCCFQSFITSTLEPSKRKYRAACELWTRKSDARVLWEIPRKRKLEEITPAASNYSKRYRSNGRAFYWFIQNL